MIELRNVLVATDFSPVSDAALAYGRALAHTFGAALHIMHVTRNPFLRATFADPHTYRATIQRTLESRLTERDRADLKGRAILETSDRPAEAIADYARKAQIDLIVMGTHGRSTIEQLPMGSVAERVVRTAPCPVLTVRHPEHEFLVPDVAVERAARA